MENPKLCKSIEHVVDVYGPIDGRTRLIKLVYLSDREWHRHHGRTYTEARYYRWNHGPFAREILSALDWLDGVEIVQRETFIPKGRLYSYVGGDRTRLRKIQLDGEFEHVLDQIAKRWRNASLNELLEHVYSRDDFKSAKFGDSLLTPRYAANAPA